MADNVEVILARIEERVKAIDEKLDVDKDRLQDHEKRIRLGEKIRNVAIGAGLLSGSGWGLSEWFK